MENTTKQPKKRTTKHRGAPSDLWQNDDIHAYAIVRRDRLDVTREMLNKAEHPELQNYWLSRLDPDAREMPL